MSPRSPPPNPRARRQIGRRGSAWAGPTIRALAAAPLAILLALPAPAAARSTSPVGDAGWLMDAWDSEDGQGVGQITDLAFDEHGFLWLSGFGGLGRFDGHAFRHWGRPDLPGLPSSRLVDVEYAAGTLWVLTEEGHVVAIREGQARVVLDNPKNSEVPGGHAGHFYRLSGVLYYAGGVGLFVLTDGAAAIGPPELRADPLPPVELGGLLHVPLRDGRVLRRELDGAWTTIPSPAHVQDWALLGGTDSQLVLMTEGETWLRRDGAWQALPLPPLPRLLSPPGVAPRFCGDGKHWRLEPTDALTLLPGGVDPHCDHHRVRHHEASTWTMQRQHFDAEQPLPIGRVEAGLLLRGPEGALWTHSMDRVMRFRPAPVPTARAPGGVGEAAAVVADPDGGVWFGHHPKLAHALDADRVRTVDSHRADHPLPTRSAIRPVLALPDGGVWVHKDTNCLLGQEGCVAPQGEGLEETFTQVVAGLEVDGDLWLSTALTLRSGRTDQAWADWTEHLLPDGRPIGGVRHLALANDGSVIGASKGGGLIRVQGAAVEVLGIDDGLTSDQLRHVFVDERDVIWVATQDRGLCRVDLRSGFVPGSVGCIRVEEGLPSDHPSGVLLDERGRLWVGFGSGLAFADRAAFDAVAKGEVDRLEVSLLDERDGLLDGAVLGRFQPAMVESTDGRFWVASGTGVSVLAPGDIEAQVPPPTRLDGLRVEGAARRLPVGLELNAEQRRVEIAWTAIDFDRADALRFRHRLGGADSDWVDAGSARSTVYSNLPPGRGRFEVQAGLAGRWGPVATLDVHRAPAFQETPWFDASMSLSGALLLGLLGAVRLRSLRRRALELEAQVQTRTSELNAANSELAQERDAVTRHRDLIAAHRDTLAEQRDELEERGVKLATQAKRIDELDQLRNQLVANLSHELRTPLGLVIGPLDDLAQDLGQGDPKISRRLQLVRRSTRRLRELVDQLLDVAHLDRGEVVLRARPADLGRFIREIGERFEPAAASKGLAFSLALPDEPLPVWFDRDLIDKVLSNLLANALKFTPAGGVTVRVEAAESQARVVVEDTGVGVPEDKRSRLFERFFQVDRGDACQFEGMGIGLSLARELVELHGGEIGVEASDGRGERFWFQLPRGADHLDIDDLAIEPQAGGPVGAGPGERDPLRGPTDAPLIFVVEDHPDMRAYIAEHLARTFRVAGFERATGALEAFGEGPAALVSDVMLPGLSGLELCRRLADDPSTAAVPRLLVTAKGGDGDRRAGLAVADAYLTKPFRVWELLEWVARATDWHPRPTGGGDEPDGAEAELRRSIDDIIAANLADDGFGVEQLAAALGQSRRQALRHIQRLWGCPARDLLLERRLAHADRLLRDRAFTSVAEVAHAVGLSPRYFSRVHRARNGETPSAALKRSAGPERGTGARQLTDPRHAIEHGSADHAGPERDS